MRRRAVLERAKADASRCSANGAALVRSLADAGDEAEVGGKARNLARLLALGAPVPDGVVLTRTAFERFLDAGGLGARIARFSTDVDAADPNRLRRTSGAVRTLVMSASIPADVDETLQRIAEDLLTPSSRRKGAVPLFPGASGEKGVRPLFELVAVRSSAVGEDSASASFAGQLDSILGVTTLDELRRAVLACWASYWSERVLFYRSARHAARVGMGVIVQRQVPARVSGVLFTCSPSGIAGAKRDEVVIEYCAGLADGLVAGRVDPGRLVVSRADLSITDVQALPSGADRASVATVFTPHRIRDLARRALQLECELGGPQDIEWAIDGGGQLWLLQARPVTTLADRDAETPPTPTVLWSNANVNENFPQPISPLLYSIASLGYYHYFRNLGLAFGVSRPRLREMERPLRAIIGVHGARMYYNLTSIHASLRMAPCGDHLTDAFNQFTGVAETAAQPRGAATWGDRSRLAHVAEILRIGAQTTWQYLFLRRRVRQFEETVDQFAARTSPEALAERPLAGLVEDLDGFVDIRCHRWKNASLADAAAMVAYALLQRSLAGVGTDPTLHNRLLRALPGVPSSIPPLRLWQLSRMIRSDRELRRIFATEPAADVLDIIRHDKRFTAFHGAFDQYLDEWGFRSSAELMLTVPSLQENPLPAIELLKRYADSDGEPPEAAISRQAAERLTETSRLLRSLVWRQPINAAAVWLFLGWTQRAVGYRERARLKQALLYTRCRQVALAIGERLVCASVVPQREDVFMLTWPEIDDLGCGRAMFPYHVAELVSLRRRQHEALAAMEPPDTMQLGEGQYLRHTPRGVQPQSDQGPKPSTSLRPGKPAATDCETAATAPDTVTLRGTGACGGQVTARAAVLGDVNDANRLERGDVLITRQTDPGWGPVFGLVSGLVIERGGMLSHGAIIAREFGLPCVTGVKDATTRIPHGARVIVNGDQGTCVVSARHILEPTSSQVKQGSALEAVLAAAAERPPSNEGSPSHLSGPSLGGSRRSFVTGSDTRRGHA